MWCHLLHLSGPLGLEAIQANLPLFHACLQQLDSCLSHAKPLTLGKFIKLFLSMVSPLLVNEQFLPLVTSKLDHCFFTMDHNSQCMSTLHKSGRLEPVKWRETWFTTVMKWDHYNQFQRKAVVSAAVVLVSRQCQKPRRTWHACFPYAYIKEGDP
jgi:hypothetical protein